MCGRSVVYVSPNARPGGTERVLETLIRHHDPARWRPSAFFLNDGPMVAEFAARGVPTALGPPMRLRDPRSVGRAVASLRRHLVDRRAEAVHSLMGYGHLVGGLAARAGGIPEVWAQHGSLGWHEYLFARIPTDALIANSRYTLAAHARYGGRAGSRHVIYPGVGPIAGADPSPWRDPSAWTVGLAGRLSPMKGHLLLLEAAATALGRVPNLRVLLIGGAYLPGDDAYGARVRAAADAPPLRGRVAFTGHLDAPWGAMAACDALAVASITPEPFGLTVVEARRLGVPVVAPAEGGPPEMIADGLDGLLCAPRDAASLAAALVRLATEPGLSASLAARGLVDGRFTADRMAREVEGVLDRVASSPLGARASPAIRR